MESESRIFRYHFLIECYIDFWIDSCNDMLYRILEWNIGILTTKSLLTPWNRISDRILEFFKESLKESLE